MREVISRNSIEADSLESYLRQHGGRMYLEGAEVFFFDPIIAMGFDFAPLFGIIGVSDGNCDLDTIFGELGTFTEGMHFAYDGENFWIDHLAPRPYSPASFIFHNNDPAYWCGISCLEANRRTVGVSFEMGGLVDGGGGTKHALIDSIMHFFGIVAGGEEDAAIVRYDKPSCWVAPNPMRDRCRIRYQLPKRSDIAVVVYDVSGRVVRVLAEGEVEQGINSLEFVASDLASGMYFLKLSVDGKSYTRKLTIIK
jgi:hypothetical protein